MHTRAADRRGFALAMVVFLLFAAAVAGVTGYQIVSAEATLAAGNENLDEALSVANAGLQRYVGEHIGVPGAKTYAIGDGSVTVTPTRLVKTNDSTELYLLTAVGTVADPRYPTSPATRTARQYARWNRRPVKARAAFMSIQSMISVGGAPPTGAGINGTMVFDAGSADCPTDDSNGLIAVPGVAWPGGGAVTGAIGGSPGPTANLGSVPSLISAVAVRWSVLRDPTFPIPYDGSWPSFGSIPADSFPVIRVTGNYTMDRNGRGALIVTGNFTAAGSYEWKGIILAGGATSGSFDLGAGAPRVKGLVVSGLNGSAFGGGQTIRRWTSIWNPCYVRKANLALSYFTPIDRSSWTY